MVNTHWADIKEPQTEYIYFSVPFSYQEAEKGEIVDLQEHNLNKACRNTWSQTSWSQSSVQLPLKHYISHKACTLYPYKYSGHIKLEY